MARPVFLASGSAPSGARGALAVLLALGAAACHPKAPPPDLSLDPGELLAQVRQAQARIHTVQGQARVHVEAPGGSGTVKQFLAAEAPDHLHLETLDFFGNVAAVLAAGDGRFALYDAREKVLYRGAATPGNLARLLPLPLPAADLVTILCGSAPLIPGIPTRAEPGKGHVTLVLEDGPRVQALQVGAAATVERSERRLAGAPAPGPGDYDLELDQFRDDGPWFPWVVRLRAEAPRVRVELRWTEVERNGALDPALFRLEPPRGARVVELGGTDAGPPSLFQPPAG